MKKNPTVSLKTYAENRGVGFSLACSSDWNRPPLNQILISQIYAKYAPHHPTDRWNYVTVDVEIWTGRPKFDPPVAELNAKNAKALVYYD